MHSGMARDVPRLDNEDCQWLQGEGANKIKASMKDHNQERSQGQLSRSSRICVRLEIQVKVEIVGFLP